MSNSAIDSGFASRKFVVVMSAMAVASLITVLAMYSSPSEGFFTGLGGFYLFLGVCVGAYQWANVRHHQHANGNGDAE